MRAAIVYVPRIILANHHPDPHTNAADYVESSGATGKTLPGSGLLFAPEPIPLSDCRHCGTDGWRCGIGGRLGQPAQHEAAQRQPDQPAHVAAQGNLQGQHPQGQVPGMAGGRQGKTVGGEELRAAEEARISKSGALIGDAALDAVFDTWAWGANIATPDKVGTQLRSWRPDGQSFNQLGFTTAAVSGRALVGIAALSFVVIQVVAYGTLFIAPALRVFANVDIGFGQMGECDPTLCTKLF